MITNKTYTNFNVNIAQYLKTEIVQKNILTMLFRESGN